MALQIPESIEGLIYWTNRSIGAGKVACWVQKQDCPQCRKALMGKPTDKAGKVKMRAKEYTCPACGHTVAKEEYEVTLTAEALYTCPHCQKDGEARVPFKRRNIEGVATLRLTCQHCKGNIDVTKKMKQGKDDADA